MNQLNAIFLNYLKFTGDKNIFSQESMECMLTGYKAMRQKSKYCMLPTEKCSESLGILSMVLFLVQDLHPKMKTWRIHEVYTAREFSSPPPVYFLCICQKMSDSVWLSIKYCCENFCDFLY